MEKLLVTGANGLLGRHLVSLLLQEGYPVVATGTGPCRLPFPEQAGFTYYDADITLEPRWYGLMEREKPSVVIHAAAMTQVDECEMYQEKCEAVNVQGTAQLLLQAEAFSRHFIYLSTDFVFDGEKGNYREEDQLNPVNWYGFTKMQAESMVEISEIPWTIVRTCLVYGKSSGGSRPNIITWVKENLEAGKRIKVVTDQWRTPTWVEDLARGILLIIQRNAEGTYHLSGKDRLRPYDMAVKTAAHLSLDGSLIEPVDAGSFQQAARRPLLTGFNISKAATELGFAPMGFEESLHRIFPQ